MSIWDAVGNGLDGAKTKDNNGKPLLATTFTANFGDTINTLMGGGRFTNLIGSDARVVFDWQNFGYEPTGMCGKVFSAFMGLGGDAVMIYGNRTTFHYSGIPFTSRRGEKPVVNFSDTQTGYSAGQEFAESKAERASVYALVGVGIAAIVALSVTVRLKYSNFAINKDKPDLVKEKTAEEKADEDRTEKNTEKNTELAKNLICGFYVICEDRWLLSLRYLDIGFQMAFLFKNTLIASKAALVKAEQDLKGAQAVVKNFPNAPLFKKNVEMLNSVMIEAQTSLDTACTLNTNNLRCYLE